MGLPTCPCPVLLDTLDITSTHTARGTLRLRLRLIPTTDTDTTDWDTLVSDTVVSDTPDSDTPTTVLLLLPLLLPLLPLLLLPSPPSTTPFSEPRLCPTPCTLWLTPGTEPSCTPAISECAPTTWASRCPARKSSGGHGVCCEESNLENLWKCVT